MSDLENDLRNLLDRRASAPDAPGDWQDLIIRMSRRNQRAKRTLSGALAFVLIAGPIVGFTIARSVTETDPGSRVTAAGPGEGGSATAVATADGEIRARFDAVGGYQRENLKKLFRRTTGDDIQIRGYITDGQNHCQSDGWCPPASCFPDALVTGELSSEAAVGFADGSHYGSVPNDLTVTGSGTFGAGGEGAPARWTVAQTSDKVATVRVSYEGGGQDEMAPVEGVVVLAAPSDVAKTGGRVEGLDRSGAVVATADVTETNALTITPGDAVAAGRLTILPQFESGDAAASRITVHPGVVAPECIAPPPTLPAPGEQPVDAGAAKADIEQTFATAYDGGLANDDPNQADAVEDSAALAGAIDAIRAGTFAEQVKNAGAKVTEVVFTSPTEASVRYDITMKGASTYRGRIGKAKLLDGRWKVARETVCADISFAGGECPAK